MLSVAAFTSRNSFGSFGQYILLLIKITAWDLTDVRLWTDSNCQPGLLNKGWHLEKKQVNSLNEKLCALWRAAMHNAVTRHDCRSIPWRPNDNVLRHKNFNYTKFSYKVSVSCIIIQHRWKEQVLYAFILRTLNANIL